MVPASPQTTANDVASAGVILPKPPAFLPSASSSRPSVSPWPGYCIGAAGYQHAAD